MAKLMNVGPDAVYLWAPPEYEDSLLVEAGQVVDVTGDVSEELDDAYIVGAGDDARAFPKSRWELAGKAPAPDALAAPVPSDTAATPATTATTREG